MCGIAGLIMEERKRSARELFAIRYLFNAILVEMDSRGGDGCGYAVIDKYRNLDHRRFPLMEAGDGWNFPRYYEGLAKINNDTTVVIGHTRLGTQGSTKLAENFHPFVSGSVVGAHNGMIYNYQELVESFGIETMLEGLCDSEPVFTIMNLMAGNKPLNAKNLTESIDVLEGVYAFTVADTRNPDEVWLLAGGNPIASVYDKELGVRFWASTATGIESAYDQLYAAMRLAGYEGHDLRTPIMRKKVYTGYKYSLKNGLEYPEDSFMLPMRSYSYYYYGNNWRDAYPKDFYSTTKTNSELAKAPDITNMTEEEIQEYVDKYHDEQDEAYRRGQERQIDFKGKPGVSFSAENVSAMKRGNGRKYNRKGRKR